MPETITIACCQTVPDVERPAASAEAARGALRDAIAAGARIVVLPELATSGYIFRSREEARAAAVPADGALLRGWAHEAAAGDAVVVGGFCELGADGRVYNSAALVDRDGVRAVYRKLHLWNDEASWFTPGDAPAPVVDTHLGRIGVAVCYDLEFPELTRGLGLAGAELIALPMNWPHEVDATVQEPVPHLLARAAAYHSKVYVAVCDRGGEERGVGFQGASAIVDPRGRMLAAARPGAAAEMLLAAGVLETARDKRVGPRNDAFADRRPEQYSTNLCIPKPPEDVPPELHVTAT